MQTLLLSPAYEPLQQISWQRAIRLLVRDRIEVVTEYADTLIRSADWEIMIPAVVRLKSWIKGRKRGVRFSKPNVYTRDKGRCQYCDVKLARSESTYDHVVPRKLKGKTEWTNIVIACVPCNQKKGGRTPRQARMRLLSKPIKPKSLPETLSLDFSREQIPELWKAWLRKAVFTDGDQG